jgi:hypothetical protein
MDVNLPEAIVADSVSISSGDDDAMSVFMCQLF